MVRLKRRETPGTGNGSIDKRKGDMPKKVFDHTTTEQSKRCRCRKEDFNSRLSTLHEIHSEKNFKQKSMADELAFGKLQSIVISVFIRVNFVRSFAFSDRSTWASCVLRFYS